MTKLLRASLIALLGLAVATPLATASSSSGVMTVDDRAGLFSADGVKQAVQTFDGTTFKAGTHYTVVTRTAAPEAKAKDLEATKGDRAKAGVFFRDWAREIYKEKRATGVLTLIYVEGDKFFVKTVADEQSDVYRQFGDKSASAVEEKFIATIREAKSKSGAEATTVRDSGLLAAAKYVAEQLKDTTVPDANKHVSGTTKGGSKGMGIGGWICLGLCVLLGVWVMIALIRALTGGGGGYGGGYGGGPGYGGGGGFFSSLLGGMFGAAAGMWMYNSFFGGGMNDMSAGESYSGDTGATDTGAGDVDGGAEGTGGGDWGDSGGNAGGGGDWGGGDFGGGGDWGGGGGDFGGGGDW